MSLGIFDDILWKYDGGFFMFHKTDNLIQVCNAPDGETCGVYIFTAMIDGEIDVIYIGCSGHIEGGKPIARVGGLKRRIYGKQNGVAREKYYNDVMDELKVSELKVYWFLTKDDDPEYVEYKLILRYITTRHKLPMYNNKLERKNDKTKIGE